jgi:3-(methylthio)propanoyl-CoA dehydrogenase
LSSRAGDSTFYETRLAVARFYADHILSQAPSLLHPIRDGASAALSLSEDQF